MFVCIYRNSPQFTEPEGSLPHSQAPTTSSYPEADLSSPHPASGGPIYTWAFQVVSFLEVSPSKPFTHPSCPHTCYMSRPSHASWFDHPNHIGWVQITKYRSLSHSLCSFLHSPVTSSLLGPNILLSTLFLLTLILCSSLNTNQQAKLQFCIF
jgi:hypothetical protein